MYTNPSYMQFPIIHDYCKIQYRIGFDQFWQQIKKVRNYDNKLMSDPLKHMYNINAILD